MSFHNAIKVTGYGLSQQYAIKHGTNFYLSQVSSAVIKQQNQSNLRSKGFILFYNSRHSKLELKPGNWNQEVKPKPCRSATYCLPFHGLFNLLSHIIWDDLPTRYTSHNGMGPAKQSIIKKMPKQSCLCVNFMEPFFSIETSLSKITLPCVKQTQKSMTAPSNFLNKIPMPYFK